MSTSTGITSPRSNISGYNLRQLPNMSPQQRQLFESLLGQLGGGQGLGHGVDYMSKLAGGDEEAFGQLEAPAYASFQKSLGDIGSRFAGAGALGSSAFQNATSGAASDLARNLGAQRHGIQSDALDRLLGLSDRLLGKQTHENLLEKKSGFGDILKSILPALLGLL